MYVSVVENRKKEANFHHLCYRTTHITSCINFLTENQQLKQKQCWYQPNSTQYRVTSNFLIARRLREKPQSKKVL